MYRLNHRKIKSFLSVILMMTLLICFPQTTLATNSTTTSQDTTSSEGDTAKENEDTTTSEIPEEGVSDMGENWPTAPHVDAKSAILIDADTGTILYEKNSHIKAYPASVTKLLTALVTVENCSLSETLTVSYDAEHSVTWEDSKLAIYEGEQFTVEDALYALLLHSANDIAYALGEHVGGTIPDFANMMNQRAAELGALNTHFANASGLNDPEHYTTAYDIAMFGRACMNNSTITGIMKNNSYVIAPTNKYNQQRTVYQRHEMLRKNSSFYYEYAVGGKTGFTDESQYTLCTFATKDDMNLIAVVLLCEEPNMRYNDTIALFNYGFDNFEKLTLNSADTSSLLGDSSGYYNSKIFGNSSLSFSLVSSSVTVPKGVTSDNITMVVNRDTSTGNSFANVQFMYDGVLVGTSELIVSSTSNAVSSTKPSNLPYLKEVNTKEVVLQDYIVFNAFHIIYGVIVFCFLLIILLGLIFMNYSEYGKEVIRTRKRRKGYRRRKLRF